MWLSCRPPRTAGIGTRLLGLTEDHARSLGLNEIRLYTNEPITEDLGYDARHGYVKNAPGRTRRIPPGIFP
jgi:hypothetical protein